MSVIAIRRTQFSASILDYATFAAASNGAL